MKNRKVLTYCAKADVIKIDCRVLKGDVNIVGANTPNLYIEYTKNLSPVFNEDNGTLVIKQTESRFWKLKNPSLTIYVPESCVPEMSILVRTGTLKITGGEYKRTQVDSLSLTAEIEDASFESIVFFCEFLKLPGRISSYRRTRITADRLTINNRISAMVSEGSVQLNKISSRAIYCEVRKGDIGISRSAADCTLLYVGKGSISANLRGNEKDFTIDLNGSTVSGVENVSDSGKIISARAAKGSVVLDFDDNAEPEDKTDKADKADKANTAGKADKAKKSERHGRKEALV